MDGLRWVVIDHTETDEVIGMIDELPPGPLPDGITLAIAPAWLTVDKESREWANFDRWWSRGVKA